MMKTIASLFMIMLVGILQFQAPAQSDTGRVKDKQEGKIMIIQDSRIELLVQKHMGLKEEVRTAEGYRIQIISSSSREKALAAKANFITKYPDYKIYLTYQQPYYKLRVGNYYTRLDAQRARMEILEDFNDSFIVKDEIRVIDN